MVGLSGDMRLEKSYNGRPEKSYDGVLMAKGTANENIILLWLETFGKSVIDFREFRLAQRIDVDFGIETIDGNIVLAEIKSDKHIREDGNFLFEIFRINHFVVDKWFYLGWGYRSPAQRLIVRNPQTGDTFVFDFLKLRTFIGQHVAGQGKRLKGRIEIVETDRQKTTFNFLIPMLKIKHLYKKYQVK